MSLRVSSLDGRVTLTLPKHAPLRAARAFLDEQAEWLKGARAGLTPQVPVAPGVRLPIEGRLVTVVAGGPGAPRLEGDAILVRANGAGARIEAFLKTLARERLAAAVDVHARRIGAEAGRITLRDTRSRWGSCSSRGDLMFSWRLILAPPSVLDYVAAHEVAHLRHMDHSAAFWALTARLCPAHAEAREWLRREGPGLHRYVFREGRA